MNEIQDRLRAYVIDNLSHTDAGAIHDGDDLFQILDSLQILRMVLQVETLIGGKVADGDLTAANFGSIEKMAAYIMRRREAAPAPDQAAQTRTG